MLPPWLQLALTRGSDRKQFYHPLTSILLLFLSLPHPLPSSLLICPPSLVLKIDTPSISWTPARSLADCLDGERKTEAETEEKMDWESAMMRMWGRKEDKSKKIGLHLFPVFFIYFFSKMLFLKMNEGDFGESTNDMDSSYCGAAVKTWSP